MKRFYLGILIAVAGANSAYASDLLQVLAECQTIEDRFRRLQCYDGIAPASPGDAVDSAASFGADGPAPTTGRWVIQEHVNPIDDTTTVLASLPAMMSQGQQFPGSIYPGSAISFLVKLLDFTTLAAEVSPKYGSRVTATFDLEGAEIAVRAVRNACRWQCGKAPGPKENQCDSL